MRKCISLFILIFMFFLSSVLVPAAENLLTNPGFETGSLGDWFNYGDCSVTVVQYAPRSGNYCAYISNRTEDLERGGPELVDRLQTGKYYNITAWVKLEGSQPADIIMTVRRTDNGETNFDRITSSTVRPGEWVEISGVYKVEGSSLSELQLYVEGPPAGISFYVDDVSVIEVGSLENWKEKQMKE